jgi:AraC-like DNA-binding protein
MEEMCEAPEHLIETPEPDRTSSAGSALDLLRGLRLTGGIFLDAEFTAPWCVVSKVGPEDCAPFCPVPHQIIAYHYVASGRLLLEVADETPVPVGGGQIVVLPRNDDHVLSSEPGLRPVNAEHLIKPDPAGGLAKIVHGGGGERTHIICGFLGGDPHYNPLIAVLPRVLTLEIADAAATDWIGSSLRFAAAQMAAGQISSPTLLAKLAELLFMEALRRYFVVQTPDKLPSAGAVHDPFVGRALGLLHDQVGRRWTTAELAREAGLSRSAFAERFSRLVGEPPMRYLARQRLLQASALLRDTAEPIARIAFKVGYESEASFTRAFKREHGVPPAAWRRRR